jgi:hypothetical protein
MMMSFRSQLAWGIGQWLGWKVRSISGWRSAYNNDEFCLTGRATKMFKEIEVVIFE